MDAVMYLFQENTSLGHWKSDRVAFMNCMFSVQVQVQFKQFFKNRQNFKWDVFISVYVNGELPSHGKTSKQWATCVDHIYIPVNICNYHWTLLCINLVMNTIEVFDCVANNKKANEKHVEPFKITIPRILKAALPAHGGKYLNIKPYTIIHVPVEKGLNKSNCDCGPYALKFIECHLHEYDLSMVNDGNINEARMKIAVDLWEAANDPIFIDRMLKYVPPEFDSTVVELY